MIKLSPYYKLVVFGLVFGLLAGGFSVMPAYGEMQPACVGTDTGSGASLRLAGRLITPSTLLRSAAGQPCDSAETGLNLVALTRTIVVSPVGSAAANGAALLAAVQKATNALPSYSNPF